MKKYSQNQIENIISELNDGAIVAVPTETVYGLAVKLDNQIAIEKLINLKDRDYNSGKIFTMMLSKISDIKKYAILNDKSNKIVKENFPGELTVILPKNPKFINSYFDKFNTIGIRIPNHKFLLELLEKAGPLIVTSANKKGQNAINSSDIIEKRLPEVDVLVEGQDSTGQASTILDLTTIQPKILRQGRLKI